MTLGVVGLVVMSLGAGLAAAAHFLRTNVREAIVIVPRPSATRDDGTPLDLDEGARVDVLEIGATSARVRTDQGEGWVPRTELRALPPYR